MKIRSNYFCCFYLLFAIFIIAGSFADAQSAPNDLVEVDARVVRVSSPDAYLLRAGSEERDALVAGSFVYEGDRLFSENGTVVLSFSNGTNLVMQRGADLYIETLRQEPYDEALGAYGALQADPSRSETRIFLSEGAVLGHVKQLRSDSVFRVETPIGTAGIRGTRFRVSLSMVEGRLAMVLANLDGSVVLERSFTLDTGEVVEDEIAVPEGESIEYIVEVDIETDEFRADPQTSIIRAAQEAREEADELDEMDEESSEYQQNTPAVPLFERPASTPRGTPPGVPAATPVRATAPLSVDEPEDTESEDTGSQEEDEEDAGGDSFTDDPDPIEIPPDLEVASPSANQ